ncbi:unnamed protein product [Thlaspi arvense]|uniref:Uncharacterized protein n=1 Tax=Thlaspi arvense TaxID=13288 RepID=A0AAU9SXM8_THLAR|nr:unnamed protein product [Thlaspi arvense]
MSRKPCCVGEGLKKGAWTAEEDKKLISYIHEHGEGGWRDIPQKAAEISSSDETPKNDGSLKSKKRSFKRSSSTSKLLNKVASRAASIGNILSASMEGTLVSSTALSPCLNDDFSEASQFQMDEYDPFPQSSEHITDHMKEDTGMIFDLNNSEYDFSQFLEQFSNEGEETENIGGYNQDLLSSDVSSPSVDEDNMMGNITGSGWSSYLVDHSDFVYDKIQDNDDRNFI